MEIVFREFLSRILSFLEALGTVCLIFVALRTGLKMKRFLVLSKILSSSSGEAELPEIWAL